MSEYILSCCSTADLSREHFERRSLSMIPFHCHMNDREYEDDLWQVMTPAAFYKAMEEGANPTTSQVSVGEYVDYFSELLEKGKDLLHVCLSSGISGSYASAVRGADIAQARYPERKIFVVDSLAASSGYGLLMDKLADLRDGGMGLEELRDWAVANRLRVHHWFFSTDLTYYIRGGRVSKVSGFLGGLLGICPLLNVDFEGRLIPRAKVRTRRKVIEETVHRMEKYADGGLDYADRCYISHSECIEDARKVADGVEARFPHLKGRVEINDIGMVIGSHTGPGTVALFFWGAPREN